MESRLIYQRAGARQSDAAPEVPPMPTPREQLDALQQERTQQAEQAVENMHKDPKILFAKTLEEQGPAFIARMQTRSQDYRTMIDGEARVPNIRTALQQGGILNGPASMAAELEDIMNAITDIPAYEESELPEHRYLIPRQTNTLEEDPRTVTYFGAKFTQMDKDRAALEQLKHIYPQHVEEFTILQEGITELARAHPGHDAHRMLTDNKGFTGEALKHFGKTMGFSMLALAGIILGTVSIINRKFDWKVLALLAGAAVIGSSRIRGMILNGKLEQDLAASQEVLHKGVIDTMAHYDVAGPHWRGIASNILEKDDAVTDAMTALKAQPQNLSEEKIKALAQAIFPTEEGSTNDVRIVRSNLEKMMRDGSFTGLVSGLQKADTTELKEVTLDFIAAGSAKTAKQLRQLEEIADRKQPITPPTSTTRVS